MVRRPGSKREKRGGSGWALIVWLGWLLMLPSCAWMASHLASRGPDVRTVAMAAVGPGPDYSVDLVPEVQKPLSWGVVREIIADQVLDSSPIQPDKRALATIVAGRLAALPTLAASTPATAQATEPTGPPEAGATGTPRTTSTETSSSESDPTATPASTTSPESEPGSVSTRTPTSPPGSIPTGEPWSTPVPGSTPTGAPITPGAPLTTPTRTPLAPPAPTKTPLPPTSAPTWTPAPPTYRPRGLPLHRPYHQRGRLCRRRRWRSSRRPTTEPPSDCSSKRGRLCRDAASQWRASVRWNLEGEHWVYTREELDEGGAHPR